MKKTFLIFILISLFACSQSESYLPEKIDSYTLMKKLTGSEADDYLNKLHLSDVAGAVNEIGFYEAGESKGSVYLTIYSSPEDALNDEQKMTNKISLESSLFIEGRYVELFGKRIFRTFGMGQTHYIFSAKNVLTWLSVETISSEEFLKAYLEYINNK